MLNIQNRQLDSDQEPQSCSPHHIQTGFFDRIIKLILLTGSSKAKCR